MKPKHKTKLRTWNGFACIYKGAKTEESVLFGAAHCVTVFPRREDVDQQAALYALKLKVVPITIQWKE